MNEREVSQLPKDVPIVFADEFNGQYDTPRISISLTACFLGPNTSFMAREELAPVKARIKAALETEQSERLAGTALCVHYIAGEGVCAKAEDDDCHGSAKGEHPFMSRADYPDSLLETARDTIATVLETGSRSFDSVTLSREEFQALLNATDPLPTEQALKSVSDEMVDRAIKTFELFDHSGEENHECEEDACYRAAWRAALKAALSETDRV